MLQRMVFTQSDVEKRIVAMPEKARTAVQKKGVIYENKSQGKTSPPTQKPP